MAKSDVQYRRADGKLPYEDTRVAISASKGDIDELLKRDGGVGVRWTDDWENHRVVLEWAKRKRLEDGGDMVIPYRITVEQTVKNPRAMFRSLFYFLKQTIVTVAYGIMSYEEAFMPYIVQRLPDGREVTLAEQAMPWLDKGQPVLNMGSLVPRLGPGEVLEPEDD
jgi:hypothetical protein